MAFWPLRMQRLTGQLWIQPGGELQFNSSNGLFLYNLAITNQGTLTWSGGSLAVGGNNSETTYITNSGLFQIFGDYALNYGGGASPLLFNAGIVRKFTGAAPDKTGIGMDLINLPSGLVDVLAGTIQFTPTGSNVLGGTFTATSPGQINFLERMSMPASTASGTGTIQDVGGNFYLRTNIVPGIKLTGCDIYITGTTTFQNVGAITNLILDGAVLHGTNRVSGNLTVNSGNLVDTLTVLPSGQLVVGVGGSQFYNFNLFNQGTFSWSGGSISVGNTIISNGGNWNITGDANVSYGGGNTPCLTNSGTIQKIAGTGTSGLAGVAFVNTPIGIVRASSGTLEMPYNYTNVAGELQLAGGTLSVAPGGTLGMTGGKLDGVGTIGSAAAFDGGIVAPGPTAGLMRFQSSLVLGTNCTLMLDGTGTVPGVSYDQLSVTGAVAVSNCALQVTMPKGMPGGTRLVIITNNSATPVSGIFNGLPEDAPLTISGQPFHIHYSGGSGNDVVLMRDLPGGPILSSGGYSNKTYRLSGLGNNPATIYTIQATTNFVQWTNLGTAIGDINGDFHFTDTNAASFNRRFYRTTN